MEVLKKGHYKLKDWFIEVDCTGEGYRNKSKPCFSTLKVEDGDIVLLDYEESGSPGVVYRAHCYGFICCECNCFTEVPEHRIPEVVRDYCTKIAPKNTSEYKNLTKEGKILSEYL